MFRYTENVKSRQTVQKCIAARHARPRAGFTIIEMLVVIAAVALLVGLLLPALRAIKTSSRQALELSAARQLMVAYINYAAANNDRVLPGHANQVPIDPSPGEIVHPLRAYDASGRPLTGPGSPPLDIARKRYLWRLAPYLKYNLRGLYVNEQQELLERLEHSQHQTYVYAASVSPSLGLNSEWCGGDDQADAPGLVSPRSQWREWIDYSQYYVTAMAQVRSPNRLLVFASARGIDPEAGGSQQPVEGYFRVKSPYFSQLNPVARWSESFDPGEPPASFGNLSFRYHGKAVVGCIDGHAEPLDPRQLRDMRRWANWATTEDWRLPAAGGT